MITEGLDYQRWTYQGKKEVSEYNLVAVGTNDILYTVDWNTPIMR